MKEVLRNGLKLIPKHAEKKGAGIIMLLSLASVLDLVSIASFIPIIFLLADPVRTQQNDFLGWVSEAFGVSDQNQSIIVLTVCAVIFVVLKTQLINVITHLKAKYAYSTASDLSSKLMNRHFSSSFLEFTSLDYTKEMNRISNLPLTFANNFIIPLGTLFSELLISIALISAIAIFDIRMFLFITAILLPLYFLYRYKRRQAENSGSQIKTTYPKLLKYALQSIEGFAEIKSFGKQNFFGKKFNNVASDTGKIMARDHALHTSISRTSELIAAIAIGGLIIISVVTSSSMTGTMLSIGVYAAVCFRAIPSLNRIFAALVQIRNHEYVVDEISEKLNHAPGEEKVHKIHFLEKIELENIHFGYSDSGVIRNLNLTLQKGERIIIGGKSGSGKTTLLSLLLNFIHPNAGRLIVDGNEIAYGKFQLHSGHVPQNPYILDDTIAGNIAFGEQSAQIDFAKVRSILHELELDDWVKTFADGINSSIGERGAKISGGQRQRIAIGRALYHDSEILLLDEITNQLDRQTEQEVMKIFERPAFLGKTIVVISHHPDSWKNFGTVYELSQGKLEKVLLKSSHTAV